jgi:hypothetical protein
VQSIQDNGLSTEEYVALRAWESARLNVCPYHPGGECQLTRHGSYGRAEPAGARVARFLCSLTGKTISLLPVCLATGVKGPLEAIEDAADAVERHTGSLEQLAEEQRPMADDDPDTVRVAGAVKWLRRRQRWVAAALVVAQQLLPGKLAGRDPTLAAFRAALGVTQVLVTLRRLLAARLAEVPAPVGLARRRARPHGMGPDPP